MSTARERRRARRAQARGDVALDGRYSVTVDLDGHTVERETREQRYARWNRQDAAQAMFGWWPHVMRISDDRTPDEAMAGTVLEVMRAKGQPLPPDSIAALKGWAASNRAER